MNSQQKFVCVIRKMMVYDAEELSTQTKSTTDLKEHSADIGILMSTRCKKNERKKELKVLFD